MVGLKRCGFLLTTLLGVVLTVPAHAQFNYVDFSSVAGLNLTGSAFQNGNTIRLTPNVQAQQGSAWYATPQNALGGFTTTFQFQITGMDRGGDPTRGADGFSFNLGYNNPSDQVGEDGGPGDPARPGHGICVSFDTFQNAGEVSDNLVEVFYNGVSRGQSNLNNIGVLMVDGAVHTATISLSAAGVLRVVLDGNTLFNRTGIRMDATGYVGFGARTGGAWENHDIVSWSFTPTAGIFSPPASILKDDLSDLSGMLLVGNAAQSGSALRLTPSAAGQEGSVWAARAENVGGDWETRFRFQITALDRGGDPTRGADGLSFNVRDDYSRPLVGERGGHFEFYNPTGLTVGLDMYPNGGIEPSDNFVGIYYNGNVLATGDVYPFNILMQDTLIHTCKITHSAVGNVTVYIDGIQIVGTFGADLSGFGDGSVGFGARTGGAWENHDLTAWIFNERFKPWDVNHDGSTDDADLGVVLFWQGACQNDVGGDSLASDINGDGCTDDADLGLVLFHQGE